MQSLEFKKLIAIFVLFFALHVSASSPAQPILPSDNIQDPGAPTTPWGGCTPTDANCYVTTPISFSGETVTGLDYSTTTGILSLTSGYVIPTIASTTMWNTLSASSSQYLLQGGNVYSAALTLGTNDNKALNFETNGLNRMTIDAAGNISATGTITAASFFGDGSGLTGIFSTSSTRGVLSTATSSPLTYNPLTGIFGMNRASTTADGYLSAADFNTFLNTAAATVNAVMQNGNAFGNPLVIGTNDTNTLNFKTNNATAMTIATNGYVGIGTTSPSSVLHVTTNTGGSTILLEDTRNGDQSGTALVFRNGDGLIGGVGDAASGRTHVSLWAEGTSTLDFFTGSQNKTNGIPRMRIDSVGNVSLGSTTASARFAITGFGTGTGQLVNFADSANTAVFTILDNGNIGVGTSSPLFNFVVAASGSSTSMGISNTSGGSFWRLVSVGAGGSEQAGSFAIRDQTNGATRMTITASGTVGIGTTAPIGQLDVRHAGASVQALVLGDATTVANGTGLYMRTTGLATITTASGGSIHLGTGGAGVTTSGLRIDSSGNVGIGTTSPVDKLAVAGNIVATGSLSLPTDNAAIRFINSGNNGLIQSSGGTLTISNVAGTANTDRFIIQSNIGDLSLRAPNTIFKSASGGTEWARITSTGQFGLGTSSPSALFAAAGNGLFTGSVTAAGFINTGNSTTTGAEIASYFTATGVAATSTFAGGLLVNGNVGIGTTTPTELLSIGSGSGATSNYVAVNSSGGNGAFAGIKFVTQSTVAATSYIQQDSWGSYATSTGAFGQGLNFLSGRTNMDNFFFRNSTGNVVAGLVNTAYSTSNLSSFASTHNFLLGGNLGLGTTSPAAKLDIWSSGGTNHQTLTGQDLTGFDSSAIARYQLVQNGSSVFGLTAGSSNLDGGALLLGIGNTANARTFLSGGSAGSAQFNVHVGSTSTPALTIRGTGNAGFGSTSPSSRLVAVGSDNSSSNSVLNLTNLNGNSLLFVRNDGNIGIGTTTPETKLSISGSGNTYADILTTTNNEGGIRIGTGNSTAVGKFVANALGQTVLDASSGSQTLALLTAGLERMRIASDGKVGIGTTGPSAKLSIQTAATGTAQTLFNMFDGNSVAQFTAALTSTGFPTFNIGSTNAIVAGTGLVVDNGGGNMAQFSRGTNVSVAITGGSNVPQVQIQNTGKTFNMNVQGTTFKITDGTVPGINDRFVIDTNGNVGIGTVSPQTKFHVLGGAGTLPALGSTLYLLQNNATSTDNVLTTMIAGTAGATQISFGDSDANNSGAIQYNNSTDALNFYSGGFANGSRLTINSSGNVGIGTTTPGALLDVDGATRFGSFTTTSGSATSTMAGSLLVNSNNSFGLTVRPSGASTGALGLFEYISGNASVAISGNSNGSAILNFGQPANRTLGAITYRNDGLALRPNFMTFNTNGVERMALDSSGNLGIGTSTPDARLSVYSGGANGINLGADIGDGTQSARLFFSNASTTQGFALNNLSGLLTFRSGALVGSTSGATRFTMDQSGNFAFNNNQLYVQQSTGFVSVGTTTASNTLTVAGTANITSSLAINIATTSAALEVSGKTRLGNINTTAPGSQGVLVYTGNSANANQGIDVISGTSWTSPANIFGMHLMSNGSGVYRGALGFNSSTFAEQMSFTSSGNVGIGTTTPNSLLAVAGDINITGALKVAGNAGTSGMVLQSTGTGLQWVATSTLGSVNTGNTGYFAYYNATGTAVIGQSVLYTDGTSLGIGTDAPTAKLEVAVNSGLTGRFLNTSAPASTAGAGLSAYTITPTAADQRLGFYTFGAATARGGSYTNSISIEGFSSQTWAFGSQQGSYLTLNTTPNGSASRAEVMRLTQDANVGIGTTTPGQKLVVNGNAQFTTVGSGAYGFDLNLTADGVLTKSSSDRRLKDNILAIESSSTLDKINKLKPSTFDWKSNGTHDIGLIAQDVQEIYPELVFTNQSDGYMGINYSRFTALLISAIQELSHRVDTILAWFKDGKFNVQSDVCVDDVCVTKDQFKQMLRNASTQQTNTVNGGGSTYTPPAATGDTSTTTTTDPVATSTDSEGSSTEAVTPEPTPTEPVTDPAPQETPTADPTPAPAQ